MFDGILPVPESKDIKSPSEGNSSSAALRMVIRVPLYGPPTIVEVFWFKLNSAFSPTATL